MIETNNPFGKNVLNIGEAARLLGVSIDTLRRWDKSGKLKAFRRREEGNRYYTREAIEFFLEDLFAIARVWARSDFPPELPSQYYSEAHPRFQSRLEKMSILMADRNSFGILTPLIVAITGEIGNNSFDHNIGNWPDVLGVFFGYDLNKRLIVLADRGRGIRATLRRVRPGIATDAEALRVGFSEFVSARAPERRGNGLKFVREVAEREAVSVELQSGTAVARIPKQVGKLKIHMTEDNIRGTLTRITF